MTASESARERSSVTPAAEAMRQLLSEGERAERRGDLVAAGNAYTMASASDEPVVSGEAAFRLGRVAWLRVVLTLVPWPDSSLVIEAEP